MKSDALPKDLLPFAPRRVIRNVEQAYNTVDASTRLNPSYALTPAQQTSIEMQATCRKAYHFMCSAYEECGTSLLVYADDIRQAQRWARDNGWSVLGGLGWCCRPCAVLYRSRGGIGPRKKMRKYKQALTQAQQFKSRLTTQEAHEIQLAQERRGNDLGEIR